MKKMLFLCVACIVFLNVVAQTVFPGQQVSLGKITYKEKDEFWYDNGTFEVPNEDVKETVKKYIKKHPNATFYTIVNKDYYKKLYGCSGDSLSFDIEKVKSLREEL